jgi:GNAT superfamily N-acetyltransferase
MRHCWMSKPHYMLAVLPNRSNLDASAFRSLRVFNTTWDRLDPRTKRQLRKLSKPDGWFLRDIRRAEKGGPLVEELRATVAIDDNRVVGWASGMVSRAYDGHYWTVGVGVFVAKPYRGCGVARRLLKRFVGAFKRKWDLELYACPLTKAGERLYTHHKNIEIIKPYTIRSVR